MTYQRGKLRPCGDLATLTTRHLKKGDKIRLNGPRHPSG
jgi:hypothetical protein